MDRTPARQPKNRGQLVSHIRAHWPWALVLAIAVVATTFAPVWGFVVLAIGLVLAGVKAAVTERVQEVFKRKPDLTLLASAGAGHEQIVEAPTLRPWPVDVDRIVAHEVEEARRSEQLGDSGVLNRLVGMGDPFAVRPSQPQKDRALAKFREDIEEFADELREWLDTYVVAAGERSRTVALDFKIASGARGAHAEAVTLVLELPLGTEVVDEWPTVTLPPDTPVYSPPRARSISAMTGMPMVAPMVPVVRPSPLLARVNGLRPTMWSLSKDMRRIEAELGDVHHGRSRELGETLIVRAAGAGSYELRWTMYVKNSRRHCTGTIRLIVPPTPARPAFGTMQAILRYPDVPFVDETGETVVDARTEDPPVEPPREPDGYGPLEHLAAIAASRDWYALGFHNEHAAS